MNPSGRRSWFTRLNGENPPRWVGWVFVALAVGVLSIAIQELQNDDPGEAFTWALLGLIVGGQGIWRVWRGRARHGSPSKRQDDGSSHADVSPTLPPPP